MKIFFIALLFLLLSGCMSLKESILSVRYRNSSSNGDIVKNIKVIWNNSTTLTIPNELSVCGMPIDNYHVKDLFGPVYIEWENAKGQKLSKDFIFRKEDFPNYKKLSSYIILYFNQTDVEYYTSDTPNIKKIQREKKGNWVLNYIEGQGKKCVNDPKERKRIDEISKKYPSYSTVTGKPIDDE